MNASTYSCKTGSAYIHTFQWYCVQLTTSVYYYAHAIDIQCIAYIFMNHVIWWLFSIEYIHLHHENSVYLMHPPTSWHSVYLMHPNITWYSVYLIHPLTTWYYSELNISTYVTVFSEIEYIRIHHGIQYI